MFVQLWVGVLFFHSGLLGVLILQSWVVWSRDS